MFSLWTSVCKGVNGLRNELINVYIACVVLYLFYFLFFEELCIFVLNQSAAWSVLFTVCKIMQSLFEMVGYVVSSAKLLSLKLLIHWRCDTLWIHKQGFVECVWETLVVWSFLWRLRQYYDLNKEVYNPLPYLLEGNPRCVMLYVRLFEPCLCNIHFHW